MQPNAEGICESYYGTWNVNNKPNLGVHVYMLDEHIKKTINNEKENFKAEISKSFCEFNKNMKSLLKKNSTEIKTINSSLNDLAKFMNQLIDINKLEMPEIEIKKSKRKSNPKDF